MIESSIVLLIVFNIVLALLIGSLMVLTGKAMGEGYRALKSFTGKGSAIDGAFAILGPVFFQCLIVWFANSFAKGMECRGDRGLYFGGSWGAVLLYHTAVLLWVFISERKSRRYYLQFFVRVALSVLLAAYFSYFVLSVDADRLIPGIDDVVFQFWLLASAVVIAVVSTNSDSPVNYEALFYEVDGLAEDKYPQRFLDDHALRALYCSFGMIEAFYRPKRFGFFESLAARYGLAKTTGIMQVKSDRPLTDEESIAAAFPIVEKIWDDFLKEKSSGLVNGKPIVSLSSGGYSYEWEEMGNAVVRNYSALHMRYMGTANFPGSTRFCREAFNYVDLQLFRPAGKVVTTRSSVICDKSK